MYRKSILIAALIAVASSNYSYAAPRWQRRAETNRISYTPNYSQSNTISSEKVYSYTNSESDQDRCQAEANYMAANNITGHVWGCIGNFEGIGYGSSPDCKTCTPERSLGRSDMKLTGDASAQGKNGKWYRVRSWRLPE